MTLGLHDQRLFWTAQALWASALAASIVTFARPSVPVVESPPPAWTLPTDPVLEFEPPGMSTPPSEVSWGMLRIC